MLVRVLSGDNKLYLFSHIRMVCALIPERFSKSRMLKDFLCLFINIVQTLNKFTINWELMGNYTLIFQIIPDIWFFWIFLSLPDVLSLLMMPNVKLS